MFIYNRINIIIANKSHFVRYKYQKGTLGKKKETKRTQINQPLYYYYLLLLLFVSNRLIRTVYFQITGFSILKFSYHLDRAVRGRIHKSLKVK